LYTDGPSFGIRPPAASIPAPTPPTFAPPSSFDPAVPGRSQSRSVRPKSEFVLIDTLGRPRDFPSGDPNQLLLIEFMTTTCPPCQKAIPLLSEFQARWGANGVEVIAVACDAVDVPKRRAVAAKYYRDHELNYLLYVEPGESPGPVMDRFQVEFYPSLVLLSGSGDVIWAGDPRQMDKLERVVRERLAK
ncbi:MAG: TlpA family protein disulfide reductase, partial [Fimbriiglobus sp.]